MDEMRQFWHLAVARVIGGRVPSVSGEQAMWVGWLDGV